jgi:carboxylate-amine ligase
MMVRQNKWRACRFGIHAELVDAFTHQVKPVANVVEDLVRTLEPVARQLHCTDYLQQCVHMATGPSCADHQATILAASDDLTEVVRQMTARSRVGHKAVAE